MSKKHRISKWSLAYHSKFTPWKKRATRGHERAAQKCEWRRETTPTTHGPDAGEREDETR